MPATGFDVTTSNTGTLGSLKYCLAVLALGMAPPERATRSHIRRSPIRS
jgi:hypothetical protein